MDVTGPFEVFSKLPHSTCRLYAERADPVRDMGGLQLVPDATLKQAPQLDVLVVPGGFGQQQMMEHKAVLKWLQKQAQSARLILSVCTGALICGAAGLLHGKRATTHWSAHQLLHLFGATPVDERVVQDGSMIFAAGVTAGIDGALAAVARLRGDEAAQSIQLSMEYAPAPPFTTGHPQTASASLVQKARNAVQEITAQREATAQEYFQRTSLTQAIARGNRHNEIDWGAPVEAE